VRQPLVARPGARLVNSGGGRKPLNFAKIWQYQLFFVNAGNKWQCDYFPIILVVGAISNSWAFVDFAQIPLRQL
jgi:hypothetical protein